MAKQAIIPRPWGDDTLTFQEQAELLGFNSTQALSVSIHRGLYKYPRYRVGRHLMAKRSEILESLETHNRVEDIQ